MTDKFPMMTHLRDVEPVLDVYFKDGYFFIEDLNGGDFGTRQARLTKEQLIQFAQELAELASSVEFGSFTPSAADWMSEDDMKQFVDTSSNSVVWS